MHNHVDNHMHGHVDNHMHNHMHKRLMNKVTKDKKKQHITQEILREIAMDQLILTYFSYIKSATFIIMIIIFIIIIIITIIISIISIIQYSDTWTDYDTWGFNKRADEATIDDLYNM